MTGKNFKSNKPLDTVSQNSQAEASTELLQPEKISKKKSNGDYLRLDIFRYRDFLSTMAGFRKMSITKYIQGLIDADMEHNREIYEKIKNI